MTQEVMEVKGKRKQIGKKRRKEDAEGGEASKVLPKIPFKARQFLFCRSCYLLFLGIGYTVQTSLAQSSIFPPLR